MLLILVVKNVNDNFSSNIQKLKINKYPWEDWKLKPSEPYVYQALYLRFYNNPIWALQTVRCPSIISNLQDTKTTHIKIIYYSWDLLS